LTWDATQLYSLGTLSIGGVLGDYKLNVIVDAPDYPLWRHSLAKTALASRLRKRRPCNHPSHFDISRAHFGARSAAWLAGSIVISNIPDPQSAHASSYA